MTSPYRITSLRHTSGFTFHGHCFEPGALVLYPFPRDSLVLSHEVDDWAPPTYIVDGVRGYFSLFSVVHPGETWPTKPGKTPEEHRAVLLKEFTRIRKVVKRSLDDLHYHGRAGRGHVTIGFYQGQDEAPGLAWTSEPLVADERTKLCFPAWWYPRESWLDTPL